MAIQHVDIADADRHEAKGASTATNNQVLTADGDGTTSFRQPTIIGWYNYDHNGATVPLTVAGTFYDLINDTLGPNTYTFEAITGAPSVWNSGTNRFDWTSLAIGDTVDVRIDVILTTTNVNTAVDLVLELATGSGTPVPLPLITQRDIKTAGTYQFTFSLPFFIGSTLIKNNPAKLQMKADKTGVTVDINGWFVRVTRPGDYT